MRRPFTKNQRTRVLSSDVAQFKQAVPQRLGEWLAMILAIAQL